MGNTQENKDAPVNQPGQTDTDKIQAQHDALYGKYSKKSADLVKVAKLAFEANPTVIEEFDDEVKDKITKEKFGFDTFGEALAVLGEGFYNKDTKTKADGTDLELTVAELVKREKVAEYKNKIREEDLAIELFITKNSGAFNGIENPKEELKKEMKKLSDEMSMDEKLEDAVTLITAKQRKVSFANTTAGGSFKADTKTVVRNPKLAKVFGNKL